ncbi:MAG: acyl-CoA synthetase [Nanohaloarchaea archaeon SW_4_43_9]|nr:MAG: acyl-CoA synthetase [Nanohaloarchaea archaeon SW_4_43_9]
MLENLFHPDRIAVVGASRHKGKTGHEIFDNLNHSFEGVVHPVNPKADEIEGRKAYSEIPEETDLAVISVPGKIVPDVMMQCAEKNVDAAIIISAGFSETGNEKREQKVLEIAEKNDIQLLGPNVLGLINTENLMNASFASKMPEEGEISFMSQSGAFCTAILDYAKAEHIGFRHFVSLGNKAMLDEIDLLEKWRNDETDVILSYTEGIDNGRNFIEEAEKTSRRKPTVMVKSGRTDKGSSAASSHTGSIAGSYQAYKAAFRKSGIIEAESNRELLDFGRAFDYQPLPEGDRVAVITNAGGPGVITTDEITERGLKLAGFSEESKQELESSMPEETTVHNPLDLIGDAGHERYAEALETLGKDESIDSIMILLTPQANTEIEKTAKTIAKEAEKIDKPIMACFIGEQEVQKGIEILEENSIPDFEDPKDAVKVLKRMNSYREFLETEYCYRDIEYNEQKATKALDEMKGYKDAEKLFSAYNFNLALTEVPEAPLPAVEAARNVGYPVVLKVDSPDIRHKTDIGAVKTGLENKEEVKDAFNKIIKNVHIEASESTVNGVQVQEQLDGLEVALGMKRGPQFGPMVMVGLGGIYIEVFHDVSFGIAPIPEKEAERMIEELESHEIFDGKRGKHHDLEPVKDAIIRLGELALNHEEITEIDLNPAILRNGIR